MAASDRPIEGPAFNPELMQRHNMQLHIMQLPARQRQVMALKYGMGLSLREIATELGIDISTVRVHLGRALGTLVCVTHLGTDR